MLEIILLFNLICMLSIIFMYLNHPLSLGFILLIQTIMISLLTGMMNYNFWFSYILFLIMIGGMLILFVYMTSVASNEKFKFSMQIKYILLINILLILIMLFMDHYYFSFYMNLIDMLSQNFIKNEIFSMNKYMNFPNNLMIYLMMLYLLVSLIMVVKMTNINSGPLRQKF